MYGKHFESMYEGSMYGAGIAVFAVWGYVISHTRQSSVELNPKKLADTLGGTVKEIKEAVEFLMKPDADSRQKEHDGRRLIKEGEFQYRVPSWEYYYKMQSEEERREYNRVMKSRERARKKISSKIGGTTASERVREEALRNGDEHTVDRIDRISAKEQPTIGDELGGPNT